MEKRYVNKNGFRKRVLEPVRKGCFIFLIGMFLVLSSIQAAEPKNNYQIEYGNGKLKINVDNVALGPVLAAIREKTGIEFVLSQELSEVPISVQLGPLPVVETLKRILSHSNHAFIFGTNKRLIKVIILNYSKWESSPRPREVTETQSVQRIMPVSPAKTKDIESPGKEAMMTTYSTKKMNIRSAIEAGMDVTSSSKVMDIKPAKPATGGGIIPVHPVESMVIKPASAEGMVVTPSTRTMANIVDSMIIKTSTEEFKPKGP